MYCSDKRILKTINVNLRSLSQGQRYRFLIFNIFSFDLYVDLYMYVRVVNAKVIIVFIFLLVTTIDAVLTLQTLKNVRLL